MENKARYTLVGLFVLIFSIAMVAFVLWLARYNVNKQDLKEFRLYVKKSVSGLKPKSIVYYKGLDVGRVSQIQINPTNLEEIEIILTLSKPSLVKTDTFAKIESQGVTGNKVIELAGGTQTSKMLQPNSNGIYIIPIKKTFLDNLTDSATNITDKADIFLTKLNMLLNEKNIEGVETLVNNANNSSKNFDALAHNINNLISQDIKKSLSHIDQLSSSINQLISKDIKSSLSHIDDLSNNVNHLSQNINILIQNDVKAILKEFKETTKSAQNIDEVMIEFENTLLKLNQTIDNVNLNGGNMIFNIRETKLGPGEKISQ